MPDGELIGELMLRWESARQEGKELTAEELCADCPQLVEDLRRRIRAVLAMENAFGITEHSPLGALATPPDGAAAEAEPLPIIPGYEITRVVDRGGMGVVYEGRQVALGRQVAIKMISAGALRPKVVARFCGEGEAVDTLDHANCILMFETAQ